MEINNVMQPVIFTQFGALGELGNVPLNFLTSNLKSVVVQA
jgi:hypothetical protein